MLVRLEWEPPLAGAAPPAEFSADEIRGSAERDHHFGTHKASGRDIPVGALAQTAMYCADLEGVIDQEQASVTALASTAGYRLAGARLALLDSAGDGILVFE